MFKLYPIFHCETVNDEACVCFQAYLASQQHSLDLSYLRYLFKCQIHHAYLADVLAGLDYLGVIYELKDVKAVIEENISGAMIKSGKHYYLTCGKIGKHRFLVSGANGYQVIDESIVLNTCIVIKFLGDFPYFKANRVSFMPRLAKWGIFVFSLFLFQMVPFVFVAMLGLLWGEIYFLKKHFTNKQEHLLESGISYVALQEWQEAIKQQSHIDLIESLLLASLSFVMQRLPLFACLDVILLGLLFACLFYLFKTNLFYKRYHLFYSLILLFGLSWVGLGCLRFMMIHDLSIGFFKGCILCFIQIMLLLGLVYEKTHPITIDHFVLFSHEQLMPIETTLESVGTIDLMLTNSCLLLGKEKDLDIFYDKLQSAELRINQEAVTQLNGFTFIKYIYFYVDLMFLEDNKNVSELFSEQIELLIHYLVELEYLSLIMKLAKPISTLMASEKELLGFLKLLCLDEMVFVFVRYAFYFQSENMIKRCLDLLNKKSTKAKVIVSLASIKLMNPSDLCAIIKTEKVGGKDGNWI